MKNGEVIIVEHGQKKDSEDWIARGYTPASGPTHPVQERYGSRYFYRKEGDDISCKSKSRKTKTISSFN